MVGNASIHQVPKDVARPIGIKYNLSSNLKELGRQEEAEKEMKRAVELGP